MISLMLVLFSTQVLAAGTLLGLSRQMGKSSLQPATVKVNNRSDRH